MYFININIIIINKTTATFAIVLHFYLQSTVSIHHSVIHSFVYIPIVVN